MKWPLITRKKYEALRRDGVVNAFLAGVAEKQIADLEARLAATQAELAHTVDCYNAMRKLEQEERWRRLKAEGCVAFLTDKARKARALMLPYVLDEEKKAS